jgi:ATP-dependent Lon protease
MSQQISEKGQTKKIVLNSKNIHKFISSDIHHVDPMDLSDRIGRVHALAKTSIGGSVSFIDATVADGSDRVIMTGSLGDVLKESVQVALSAVRWLASSEGIEVGLFKNKDVHIHMADGSTKKEGPSAGLAMATALYSAFTSTVLRGDVAMTGEISLRGEAMPIGGLRDKVLAAHREGFKKVLLPYGNRFDIKSIPSYVLDDVTIVTVKNMKEVLTNMVIQ